MFLPVGFGQRPYPLRSTKDTSRLLPPSERRSSRACSTTQDRHLLLLGQQNTLPAFPGKTRQEPGSLSRFTSPAAGPMPLSRKLSPRRGFSPRNAADAGAVPASTHSKLNARTVLFMAAIIPECCGWGEGMEGTFDFYRRRAMMSLLVGWLAVAMPGGRPPQPASDRQGTPPCLIPLP